MYVIAKIKTEISEMVFEFEVLKLNKRFNSVTLLNC